MRDKEAGFFRKRSTMTALLVVAAVAFMFEVESASSRRFRPTARGPGRIPRSPSIG
jgi:hypothetical protein